MGIHYSIVHRSVFFYLFDLAFQTIKQSSIKHEINENIDLILAYFKYQIDVYNITEQKATQ